MAEEVLLVDDPAPKIRRLTLNRPDKRNALDDSLRGALFDALRAGDRDKDVSVMIVRGAGSCFSAGYDLSKPNRPVERAIAYQDGWWAKLASRAVRMRSDLVVVALDLALAASAFALMLLLRYDASVPDHGWSGLATFLPFAWGTIVLSNFWWGLYGQLWRHASLHEAQLLLKSGATVMVVLLVVDFGPRFVPISVVVTGTVAATLLMGLLRFQSRLFSFRRSVDQPGLGVVVIGSGDAGAGLVSDMLHSPRAGFRPVAVLDEDPDRQGRSFMGVPIVGGIDDLTDVVAATGANLAVFAMTNAPQETVRRATAAAEAADIAMKIVPGMSSRWGLQQKQDPRPSNGPRDERRSTT